MLYCFRSEKSYEKQSFLQLLRQGLPSGNCGLREKAILPQFSCKFTADGNKYSFEKIEQNLLFVNIYCQNKRICGL